MRDRMQDFIAEVSRLEHDGLRPPYRARVSPLWAAGLRWQIERDRLEREARDARMWAELRLPGEPPSFAHPAPWAPEEFVDGYYVGELFGIPMYVDVKMGSFAIEAA